MKIAALDIGDAWTGSAISDPLCIIARPHSTVATQDLVAFIKNLIETEQIHTIVVGYPETMKGTESAQTKKTKALFDTLTKIYPQITWKLWDERLTSKQAAHLKKQRTKEDKRKEHSIAAALILTGYLEYKSRQG